MDTSDIRDKPGFLSRFFHSFEVRYQYFLDQSTPFIAARWVVAVLSIILFVLRIYYLQGFYIVCYALFIYYLNCFLLFLTPSIDPALEFDDDDGPVLPSRSSDEFRPFMRRLPEFKFWYKIMASTVIALFCTLFDALDVPVFWPILVMYFCLLTFLTMKRQIMHMIKYKYIPFTMNKPRMNGKEDTGKVVMG